MILRTDIFRDNCTIIKSALDSKNSSLYTETLELSASGTKLSMNVTNREYYTTVEFDLDEEAEFSASINAQLFLSLISKMTTPTIELEIEDKNIKVIGNGEYKIPLIFKDDKMLELPKIELNDVSTEMTIKNSILQSILKFNSKELQRGVIVKDCQAYYYVDEHGCLTFTSGACVNNFELASPIKMLLSEKVVKLFKLFKAEEIEFKLGTTKISDTLTQTRVMFKSDNVTLTTILPTDERLLSDIPVTSIRSLAVKEFPYSIDVNRDAFLQSLNRLMLFNTEKNYGRFTFSNNCITIKDWSSENVETIQTNTECDNLGSYEAIINMNNLNLILSGCEDENVTLSLGDHTAVVVKKQDISDIIPELIVRG